jgi:hypothetical protein
MTEEIFAQAVETTLRRGIAVGLKECLHGA